MRMLLEFVRSLIFFLFFIYYGNVTISHLVTQVSIEPLEYIYLRDLDSIFPYMRTDLWVTMHGDLISIILCQANLPRLQPEI